MTHIDNKIECCPIFFILNYQSLEIYFLLGSLRGLNMKLLSNSPVFFTKTEKATLQLLKSLFDRYFSISFNAFNQLTVNFT